ncbi:hypothetical protein QQP08_017484 [Theobroma cacao]|nr:hypothetical protein QQP08_017484 [Theobroma cacao]
MVNLAQICFIRSNRHIKVVDVCEAKAMKVVEYDTGYALGILLIMPKQTHHYLDSFRILKLA